MKIPYLRLAAASAFGLLASCASPVTTTTVPMSTASVSSSSSLNDRVLQEVNRYRVEKGASQLRRHTGLDRLAHEHAQFLKMNRGKFGLHGKNVSHFGFEGRALRAQHSHGFGQVAENVVSANTANAGKLVELWSHSQSHEYTMRANAYQHTGIGTVVDDDGTVFCVQLFGAPGASHLALTDRFTSF